MGRSDVGTKLRAIGALVENRALGRPLSITLELTRRCNARCDYCNHWREQKQTEQDHGYSAKSGSPKRHSKEGG